MFKRSSTLLMLATLSSASHAVVLLDSPGAGEPYLGCTPQCLQSLYLWANYDPTVPLWDQIDEAGIIDGDSVVYDRAVLAPTSGNATHISWNGLGTPGLGFIIGIWDQSVQPATPDKGMPGFGLVPGGGTNVAELSLPVDTVATSPSVNGMTHYDATIPPLPLIAGHLYKISISAVSGTFQWEAGVDYLNSNCWNSTECKNWMWHTGAVRRVAGSVDMGWTPMAYQLYN